MKHQTGGSNVFRNQRVWVTGGAGFIGSHLVEALVRGGARVTVLDNLQAGAWANLEAVFGQIERREADVRDGPALRTLAKEILPRLVFHLAANASVPLSVERPEWDFENNCLGTVRVLETLRRAAPGARLVFSSSAAVYGEPATFPITEQTPLMPISPYGCSKVAAEAQCRLYHQLYSLDTVVARIFNTYGPRMPRFVLLDFLKKLRADPDALTILGSGRQVRDFTYVDDSVAGLLLAASAGTAGEAYNIASGASCNVTALAELLIRVLGLERRTKLTFSQESWPGDAQRWEVSVTKARSIGYEPKTSLEEGVRRVASWFDTAR